MKDSDNKNRQSRRRFLAASAGAAAALGAGPGDAVLSAQNTAAIADDITLSLVNGKIHTMDDRNTVAATATIRNGRFITVGGPTPKKGPNVRTIDLKGRTVVPGLVEPHIHIVSLANRPGYHTILENTTSIREVQDALAARRKDVPAGAWITSMGGWHPNQWAEHRHPTLAELDAAVPDHPVLLYERFTGPAATNSLGKAFFDAADAAPPVHPDIKKINVSATGAIAPAGFAGGGPSASALFLLRRMQTFDDKKRSTVDAMRYSVSVGLTSHLDQVLFPTPGPLHPNQILSNLDQYRMYDSWLDLHRQGLTIVRLQMNFLQNQSDPQLPELKERLRNQFQFFGDDMMRTGSIGEWAAPLGSGAVWVDAQRIVGRAGWRNENAVQNLAGLRQVVEEWEAVNKENDITKLRWVVHHVPEVNADLLTRLKAMGCGVEMGAFRWVTSADPEGRRRAAVPNHRRSRHSGWHPRRRRPHRAAEPVAAHLLRHHRHQFLRRPGESRPAPHARRSAPPVHAQQQLVPAHGRKDRLHRAGQACRPRRLRSRLFRDPRP